MNPSVFSHQLIVNKGRLIQELTNADLLINI